MFKVKCSVSDAKSMFSLIWNRWIWIWQGFITLVVVYIAAVWKCNVRTVVQSAFGGGSSPAPLRSDAKVSLRAGLCDMDNTDMQCMLGHQVRGPVAKKKYIYIRDRAPQPALTPHVCALNANDHNCWTTMPVKRQSGAERKKHEKRSRTSLSGRLHSQSNKY